MTRYRFADFVLSPRRRMLVRAGRELRLIPRYFDLLVFLIEHRHEAVHRRDIFDRVWSDVVVSDSALSQAIRTLRRTLGDDSKEPLYIRTVARHGYRFVFTDVVEEDDTGRLESGELSNDRDAPVQMEAPRQDDPAEAGHRQTSVGDPFEPLLDRLLRRASNADEEQDRRDSAERLHLLGTDETLRRLGVRPGHPYARAMLRDTRWDVPGAGAVPLLGQPGAVRTAIELAGLRLRRVARLAAERGTTASLGAGASGALAGILGGIVLAAAPGSEAPALGAVVLGSIGAVSGALGGAGVGAGISLAEALVRSRRTLAIAGGAAVGGGFVGYAAQWLVRWGLTMIVGVHAPVGGGMDGVVLGATAGLGYGWSTHGLDGGLAAPRGTRRLTVALWTAIMCGLGALALTAGGRPLVGGTIHMIAERSNGSQAVLTPLGRLVGEPDFGAGIRALIGTSEGCFFGFGLALGLTRRSWSRKSHRPLTNR